MNEFPPSRQRGLVIHIVLAFVLGLISLVALWFATQSAVGLPFTLYLLLFVATVIPAPILAYRAYALTRANYLLDRNTLRLVWGLRVEEIPITEVEWIRPVTGLLAPISLPLFRLPGGILGVTRQPDIGKVEFMASEARTLLLVATPRQIYAISPENPAAFSAAFQKTIELGSLQPVKGRSQYPTFVIARAWDDPLARYLWMAGGFLNIGLLVWVTVLIPTLGFVPLGFRPGGAPLDPIPGSQLILLPLLSGFLYLVGLLFGLFFYRKTDQQILALAVWASGALSALFFLVAVFFILSTPI
ncbi:MAG: PH domain-containing protein [Chloroflexi bacterium]|nr:PH domain-containing protein [Chloroflexota bacterium]